MASLASITFTSPDAAGSRVTLSNSPDTQEKTHVEIPVSVSGNTSPLNQVVKVSINSPDNAEKMLPLFLPAQTSTSISTTVQSRSVPIPLSCSNTYKKSCWLRPCKITSFIRCGFEEAALRYAAKQRWVALFPDTSKASEPAPTTLSDLTKPYMEGRWTNDKVRGGYKKRPMQPVTPIVHHAPLPHQHPAPKPPAPAPHLDHVTSRWCEEGDSVVNRIQEMRSQFVPPPTRLSSQIPTPAPPRFSCYASTFAPPPTAMLPYQIRQQYARGPPVSIPTQEHGGTRPLFRGAQNQDTCMPQQEKEEEDEWVDIEDVSPPHMTYHLYRMSADGSSLALPITVTPSHIHESGNTALHINPGTDSHQSFPSAPNLNQHGPLSTVSNHNASLTVLQHQQQVEMPQKRNISHTKPGYKLHFTNIPQSSIHTKVAASGVVSSIPWDQRKKDTVGKDQDNDVVVVSSSSKDIVVISSDSSPEVDTQENSPQQTSTKTQKSSYKSTKDTDKASNSVLCQVKLLEKTTPAELKTTYENDELPDLDGHTWPPPCKSNTQLQSNFNSCPVVEIKDVNDVANLSGASTIIFEDIEEKNVAPDETPNPNSPMNSVSSVILPDLNKPVSSNIRLESHSGSGSHLEFPDFKLLDTSSDEAPSTPKCDNENIKNTVLPQKKQSFRQEGTIVRPLLGEVLEIKENLDTKGLNSPKQTSVPDATVECSRSENKTNVGNKNHADDESKDSGVIVELEVISEGSNLIKNLDSEVNQNEERDPVVLTQSTETITSVINEGVIVKKVGELDFLEYNKSENFNINSSLCKDGIFNLCSVAGKVPEKIGSDFGTVTENEVRKVHSQPLPSIQKSIPPIDGCSKTLPEQQSDYCEFVDTSRIIFVSDGKLVVAVHVTQNSQDASAHSPDTEAASISHSPLFSQDSHSSELSESDSITSRDKNTTENKEEEVTELRVMSSEELPKKRDEVVPGKHSEIINQGNTSCEEHECLSLDTARLEIDIDKTGMIKSNLYECMLGKDQADCASDDILMICIDQNGKVDIIQASPTLPAAHPVSHTSGLDCQTDILMSDTKEAHNVGYQNVEERNTINEDIPSAKQESAKTLQLSEITEEGTEDGTNLKISPNILMQHHVMIPEFTNETSRPGWLQKNDWIMHELRQEFRIMGERKMKMIDETGSCTKVKNVDIHEPVFEKTEESDYLAAAGDLKDRNMQVHTNESTSFPSCNDNVNKMSKESDGTNEALEKEFIKTSSSVTVYEKQVKVMTAIGKSQVRQDNTDKEMEYGFVSRSDDNIRGMSSLDCIDSQSTNKEKCLSGAQESSQMHLTSTVCPLTDSEPCSNIDEHQEQEITQQNSCTIIPKKYNKNDLEIVSCAEKQTMTQGSLKENINIKKQAKYSINEDQIEQKEVAYFKNDTLIASDKENISRYMTEDQTQALQNYTSIPLSSMKVIGSHSDVKQSSFPTQSLPVSKFVSRLSKKIEELAPSLKPHITTPARTSKCPRDFSTTLNDFIAKHRMAEEKDGARIGSDVSLLSTAPLDQGTRTELGSNIQAPSHTAFKVLSPIQPTESTLSFTRSIQFHSSVLSENLQPSAILQLTDKVASLPSASPPASVQLACTTLTSTCIQSPTVIQARDNVKSSQWDNTQASNELACNTQPLTSSSEQVIFQSPLKFLIVTPPEPSPITQPSTTTPSISFSMSPITASSLVSSVDMAAASTDQSPITQVLCRSEEILSNQTLGVHSDQTDHTITQQPFIASTQSSIIVQSPLSTQPSVICKPSPVCTQPAVSAQQSDINQSPISTQSSVNNQPSVSIQSPVNTQPSIIVQSQVNAQPSVSTQSSLIVQSPVNTQPSVCTQLSLIVQSPVNTQPSIGPQLPVTTQSPSSSNISSPVSDTPILDVEVVEDCDDRKTEGNASYRESLMDIRTETSYKEDTNIINRGEDVSGKEGSMKKQTGSNEEYDLCDSESDTSGLEDVLCEERDVLEKEGDIKRRGDVSKMQHDTKRRRMNMLYEDREEAEKENYNQRREDVSNKENELLSKEGDIERKDVSYKEKDVSDMENDKKRRIYVSCNEQSVSDKGNCSKEKDVSTEKNEREKSEDVSDKDNEGKGESVVSSSRKRRRSHSPNHRLLQLSLPGTYIELVNLVSGGGEALVGVLKERGVIGPNTTFTSLKPDHTRSLLAQMIRTLHSVGDSDQLYVKLLRLHGLVKALDLLQHHGLECAIHCLTQYQTTHCVLLGGYYKDVMSQLKEKQQKSGGEAAHPKVAAFVKEMSKARSLIDPNDNDLKVLVVARREGQWVYQLLHQHIGEKRVTHLISPIDYHKVLHVLEEASVVVWEEDNGLQQLPCSQFSLVVEWEAGGEASPCVRQCVRQNIRVVSFNLAPVIGDKGSEVDEAGEGSTTEHIKDKRSKRRRKKSDSGREELRIIASSTITANSELHYILTSIYNITLTERSLGDVSEEDEGERGWPDLVLDERTCVILKPLSLLRSDLHLNQLTHRVALLSQQCTACYIILYSNPAANSGYEFRSSVLRALVRLVAVCALLRSQDYTVSLLLANSLHHVGLMVRQVCEAARNVSPVWDHEEWNIRPWLTAHMSVHERFLLTLPCINSMSAQIILTAMSLTEVLTQPLSHLLKCLPWIPQKVVKRLHHHVHEDSPIAATSSFHTNQREGGGTTCDPTKTDLTHKTEEADPYHSTTHTAITAAHPHGDYNMERTYNNTVLPYTTGVGVNTVVAASAHPSNLFSVSSSSNIQPSFPTEPEFCAALPSSYSYSTHLSSQNDLTKNAATLHSNGSFNNSSEAAPCTFYNTDRSQVHAQKEISNGTVVLPGSINDMSEYGASTFSNSNRTSSHQMTAHDPKPVASVSHYSSFDSNEDDKKFTVPFQSNTGSSLNYVEPFSGTVVKTEESSTDLFNPQEYLHSLCYSDVALGERGLWPQPQYQVPVESAYNPHSNSCYVRNISDNRGLAPVSQNWHMGLAAAHESHIAPVQNMYVGSSQVCHSVIENLERTNQPRAVQPLYYNPREEGADANQKVCREIMCSEQTPWQQQKPGEQTSHLTGYWYRSSHPGNYNTRVYGIATPQQREREGMMVSVPPTPHVTMRQPGRGHDFPSHYNLTPSQTTHSRAGSKGMNGDMGRLAYERVPGKGGQTQLIFK